MIARRRYRRKFFISRRAMARRATGLALTGAGIYLFNKYAGPYPQYFGFRGRPRRVVGPYDHLYRSSLDPHFAHLPY